MPCPRALLSPSISCHVQSPVDYYVQVQYYSYRTVLVCTYKHLAGGVKLALIGMYE
jgi:hypothetical protein